MRWRGFCTGERNPSRARGQVRQANVTLRTKVSVAGKRNFEGRDKGTETASKRQGCRRRDKASLNNPANSGAIAESREISVRPRVRGTFVLTEISWFSANSPEWAGLFARARSLQWLS